MKNLLIVVFVFFGLTWVMKGFDSGKRQRTVVESRTITVNEAAADGLDLKALTELVKKVSTAKELEKELNREGGINNLDLNADKKVDFIKVTEFGNGKDGYGFSLTTEPQDGQEQEIATIQIVKDKDRAEIQVQGNEHIYGNGYHYSSFSPLTSILLWSYLFSPHPFYHSPWHYNNYPSYYGHYSTIPHGTYSTRVGHSGTDVYRVDRSSYSKPSKPLNNPNAGKVAESGIKRTLAKPTATQKQFQTRSSTGVSKGGFGRSTNSSTRVRSGGFGRSTGSSGSFSARGFSSSRGGFSGGGK